MNFAVNEIRKSWLPNLLGIGEAPSAVKKIMIQPMELMAESVLLNPLRNANSMVCSAYSSLRLKRAFPSQIQPQARTFSSQASSSQGAFLLGYQNFGSGSNWYLPFPAIMTPPLLDWLTCWNSISSPVCDLVTLLIVVSLSTRWAFHRGVICKPLIIIDWTKWAFISQLNRGEAD